jgi:hypothetical protein
VPRAPGGNGAAGAPGCAAPGAGTFPAAATWSGESTVERPVFASIITAGGTFGSAMIGSSRRTIRGVPGRKSCVSVLSTGNIVVASATASRPL